MTATPDDDDRRDSRDGSLAESMYAAFNLREGILPSPESIREYERILPGSASRILSLLEDETAHSRAMETLEAARPDREDDVLIDLQHAAYMVVAFLLMVMSTIAIAVMAVIGRASISRFGMALCSLLVVIVFVTFGVVGMESQTARVRGMLIAVYGLTIASVALVLSPLLLASFLADAHLRSYILPVTAVMMVCACVLLAASMSQEESKRGQIPCGEGG